MNAGRPGQLQPARAPRHRRAIARDAAAVAFVCAGVEAAAIAGGAAWWWPMPGLLAAGAMIGHYRERRRWADDVDEHRRRIREAMTRGVPEQRGRR